MKRLDTAREVIDALGGNMGCADLIRTTPQTVNNWYRDNIIPSKEYPIVTAVLDVAGYTVPDSVFTFRTLTKRKRRR